MLYSTTFCTRIDWDQAWCQLSGHVSGPPLWGGDGLEWPRVWIAWGHRDCHTDCHNALMGGNKSLEPYPEWVLLHTGANQRFSWRIIYLCLGWSLKSILLNWYVNVGDWSPKFTDLETLQLTFYLEFKKIGHFFSVWTKIIFIVFTKALFTWSALLFQFLLNLVVYPIVAGKIKMWVNYVPAQWNNG